MAAFKSAAKRIVPTALRRKMREHQVARSVLHLHGPKRVSLGRSEAAVTCVVKNVEFYIEKFIEHYFKMGFHHIILLDNGSTDETIALAKQYDRVSVCQSFLPIQANQGLFKRYLGNRYIDGGWCLDADADEFFDYPFSDVVSLRQFLDYLNHRHATAVVTQLLDMFSAGGLSDLTNDQQPSFEEAYPYYDLSNITKVPYRESDIAAMFGRRNTVTNADTRLLFGGIRRTLYGNNCLLTKHSLYRCKQGLEIFDHIHFVDKARLADVSAIMRHYKLTSNALETAIQNRQGFTALTNGYDDFIEFLTNQKNAQIASQTAMKFDKIEQLIDCGFVFVSPDYLQFINSNKATERCFPGAISNGDQTSLVSY